VRIRSAIDDSVDVEWNLLSYSEYNGKQIGRRAGTLSRRRDRQMIVGKVLPTYGLE
jgi:hypothetical protein